VLSNYDYLTTLMTMLTSIYTTTGCYCQKKKNKKK